MNSVALPAIEHPHEEPWDDVRRIYRRICVLRATSRHAEALDLEIDALAKALSSARAAAPDEPRETAVLAEEAERVSHASVLAELIAPLLAEKLAASSPTLAPRDPIETTTVVRPVTTRTSDSPSAPNAAPASPPSITDMIDGMLAQGPALSRGSTRR